MKGNIKKIGMCLKACALLAVFCLLPQQRAGTTADKSLPVQIQLTTPLINANIGVPDIAAGVGQIIVLHPLTTALSLTKYIQEKFIAPEVTEAFRHSGAAELEKTAAGIKLKTGYLGSSKPQAALKPEEIKALEAMAARDNFKEDGLPVFTLGNSLDAGYAIKHNGNVLRVRHILKDGKTAKAVIEGGAVTYPDSHKDTSILYVMSPGRCQEMLLLKSAKAPKEFEYEYSKEVSLNEKGEIAVDRLTLSRPVIFDAAGRRVEGSYRQITKTKVLLAFNGAGLRYPLLIDPTWQAAAGSMNSARSGHTATLLPNGTVLLAGGNGAPSSAELYDPAAGTFSPAGSMVAARSGHTATLLPNGKVLMVGGSNGGALSSVELYDPTAGTFSATGSMSAARYSHTATLLPNGKVLAAGGYDGGSYLSSAELYDPTAGTFSATGSMSAVRGDHSATVLPNGKLLVAGGWNGGALSSAELYDPAAGTFSATGSMSAARRYHSAILLPNGKLLVAGGSNGGDLSSAELYDPAAGTFSATGSMSAARERFTVTLLPNGKVLAAGGSNGGALSSAELYDPTAGTFSATGSMSAARYSHTATLLPNGNVLVTGGYNGSANLSSAELYGLSGGNGAFSATGSMSTARYSHTATLLPNGKVLLANGTNSPYADLLSAELYDPGTGNFSATGSLSAAKYGPATLLPNGKVLLPGSVNGANLSELYDPAAGTFSPTGSMSTVRYSYTATLLPNGKVLVAGGNGGLTSAELYDPNTGTFSPTGSLTNGGRMFHTATLLPNGKVLLIGGNNGAYRLTAELYDPAAGTFSATGSMLGTREFHTATLLPNGKVLVAGGMNAMVLSSAELYDPAAGTFSPTGSMSVGRVYHTATLLPNGKVLITGGFRGGASAELYDPAAGTFSAADSMSVERDCHTATLLPNGKVLVVGGGYSSTPRSSAELYDTLMGEQRSMRVVRHGGGSAIPGAAVEIYSSGVLQFSFTTNANGAAAIGLSNGTYDIFATAPGYIGEFNKNVVFDNTAGSFELTLSPAVSGLVGLWGFDEGSGTAVFDYSGYGHHGTAANAAWTAGKNGEALTFNGVNSAVTVTNDAHFNLTHSITITAWIKYSSYNAGTIVGKMSPGWDLALNSSDQISFTWGTTSASQEYILSPNAWHHIAATADSGFRDFIYLDGAEVLRYGGAPQVAPTNLNDLIIGSGFFGSWAGSIDEVRVYNRALSANEIAMDAYGAGYISGKVTESDGTTPIPGATVEALQGGALISRETTDISGNYSIAPVVGAFDVRANANGYPFSTKTGISVSAGQTVVVNFALSKSQAGYKTMLGDNLFSPKTGGTAKINFSVPSAGSVSLKIYDLSGKLIRNLYEGSPAAGAMYRDWDGKDDSGRYVVPSVYFLHYVYPGGKEVRKIGVKR